MYFETVYNGHSQSPSHLSGYQLKHVCRLLINSNHVAFILHRLTRLVFLGGLLSYLGRFEMGYVWGICQSGRLLSRLDGFCRSPSTVYSAEYVLWGKALHHNMPYRDLQTRKLVMKNLWLWKALASGNSATQSQLDSSLTKTSRDAGTTPGHLDRLTERCTIPWTPDQPPGQWDRCVIGPALHQVHRHASLYRTVCWTCYCYLSEA